MEKKINIAELLKDCPKGMELNCTTWENITFEKVVSNEIYIKRNNKDSTFDKIVILNRYGCTTFHKDEKCRIFPKGKTTWEGFQRPFKDGDIVVNASNKNSRAFIYAGEDDTYYHCYIGLSADTDRGLYARISHTWVYKHSGIRFATEEEKQTLFDIIKENGYKWNAETKTLEKLIEPKFQVGDRVRTKKNAPIILSNILITKIKSGSYEGVIGETTNLTHINFKYQDQYELVPNKFDINTLVPFESRVLVRDSVKEPWKPYFFGCLSGNNNYPYIVIGGIMWKYCIPYKNNEHLLWTTNDCDDYYKTWE